MSLLFSPKRQKRYYENLDLLTLVQINIDKYLTRFDDYDSEKNMLFKLSLTLLLPIVSVISFFCLFHFNTPWWSFLLYAIPTAILSFFFVSFPVYRALVKPMEHNEQNLCIEIDEHLTELAKQNYFSKDSKAKRLLNQEFQLVKLEPVNANQVNLILNNQTLATKTFDTINIITKEVVSSSTLFYEQRPMAPIILATIKFLGPDKKFSRRVTVPIEFELVRGLVSEQITYLDKENYIVNPMIYIDFDHFQEIYESE